VTPTTPGPASTPPAPGSGEGQDLLQLLSYFQLALGLLMIMAALVPAALLLVGSEIGAPGTEEIVRTEGARAAAAFSRALAAGIVVLGIGFGAFVAYGARALAARRSWALCVVANVVLCFFFPLGTLLGGYILTRLFEPAIRASFR